MSSRYRRARLQCDPITASTRPDGGQSQRARRAGLATLEADVAFVNYIALMNREESS
jgi:hypothetical protein